MWVSWLTALDVVNWNLMDRYPVIIEDFSFIKLAKRKMKLQATEQGTPKVFEYIYSTAHPVFIVRAGCMKFNAR